MMYTVGEYAAFDNNNIFSYGFSLVRGQRERFLCCNG